MPKREGALTREHLERRLTAILAADVAGYSRLTGIDEEGTHVRLKEHVRILIDSKVIAHRGRVVKETGDGLLVEFSSAVDAVRCAREIQRGMVQRNADVPPNNRVEFRLGVNVGDVIEDDEDILATVSTWRYVLKPLRSRAAFVFPTTPTDKCAISSTLPSRTQVSTT